MKKIIADSSLDLNNKLKKLNVNLVPFKLYLGDKEYIDDESLNPLDFINDMVKYKGLPKSACPSPKDFLDKISEKKDNFIVTISKELSGTYNSAKLAKKLFDEKNSDGSVHIFNSKSASVGETLVAIKINELIEKKFSTQKIINQVEEYIENMRTFFVAESLDNLIKNGRISKLKGNLASIFNIKPIMGTNTKGEIILYEKCRGLKKTYRKLKDLVKENGGDMSEKILGISHVNNLKRATYLKELIEEECNFKDIVIMQTGGLSSLYCDDQGIILAF